MSKYYYLWDLLNFMLWFTKDLMSRVLYLPLWPLDRKPTWQILRWFYLSRWHTRSVPEIGKKLVDFYSWNNLLVLRWWAVVASCSCHCPLLHSIVAFSVCSDRFIIWVGGKKLTLFCCWKLENVSGYCIFLWKKCVKLNYGNLSWIF